MTVPLVSMFRGKQAWFALGVLALHLALVGSVTLSDNPVIWPMHNDTVHRAGRGVDFNSVYRAALHLQTGRSLYDDQPDPRAPISYPFRYLPPVAYLGTILLAIPPRVAYLAWVAVVELCLAWATLRICQRAQEPRLRMALLALLLLNSPYLLELYMGQFTFVTTTLCALCIWSSRGTWTFALGTLLKPFCLIIAPALARERRYWPRLAVSVVLLLLTCVPYFWVHPADWKVFTQANFFAGGGLHGGNFGFLKVLRLLVVDLKLKGVVKHWAAYVGLLRWTLIALTALATILSRSREAVAYGIAALVLAHWTTFPQVWEHHYSAHVVLGALLLTSGELSTRWRFWVLGALLCLALPTPFVLLDTELNPEIFDPTRHWSRAARYVLVLPKVLPQLVLFAAAASMLVRDGLRTPRETWRSVSLPTMGERGQERL